MDASQTAIFSSLTATSILSSALGFALFVYKARKGKPGSFILQRALCFALFALYHPARSLYLFTMATFYGKPEFEFQNMHLVASFFTFLSCETVILAVCFLQASMILRLRQRNDWCGRVERIGTYLISCSFLLKVVLMLCYMPDYYRCKAVILVHALVVYSFVFIFMFPVSLMVAVELLFIAIKYTSGINSDRKSLGISAALK